MSANTLHVINWPSSMKIILKRYWKIQEKNTINNMGYLSEEERQAFTNEMIQAYDNTDYDEKKDVLVPRSGKFLTSAPIQPKINGDGSEIYSIYYNFPPNDGFVIGTSQRAVMKTGEKYDRIGDEYGHFLSRILSTGSQSVESRSLPYYIPEEDYTKNPSYHIYTVIKDFEGHLEPVSFFNIDLYDNYEVLRGTVEPAFEAKGLGEQTVIPKRDFRGNDVNIQTLVKGEFLSDK